MKKNLVLCIVIASALICSSVLYAAKSGKLNVEEPLIKNEAVAKGHKQFELIPSLLFF